MKKLLLILSLITLSLTSCENVQDNQTAIQATVDGESFNALYSIGNVNEDGSVDIETSSNSRVITLHLSNPNANSFNLNGNNGDYATYTDVYGNTYSTKEGGSGTVEIVDRCKSCGTINGRFNFTAVLTGIDIVEVNNGMFVDVVIGVDQEQVDDNKGTLNALIDSANFNAPIVNTIDTGNFILIEGQKGGTSLIIRIPITAQQGDYNITSGGFNATLVEGMITQNANNGGITILYHNQDTNTIRGVFNFQVGNTSITQGQFDVTY